MTISTPAGNSVWPLGVISGNLSLLQAGSYGPLNEEQKKAIDIISKQSSLLVSMVEELLGFTIVCSHSSRKEIGIDAAISHH